MGPRGRSRSPRSAGGRSPRKRVRGTSFPEQVVAIVSAVPAGRVISYGDVARLTGRPRAARAVGTVLRGLPDDTLVPWHRVVSRDGRVPSAGRGAWAAIQRARLGDEGVPFDEAGRVVMELAAFRGRLAP